MGRRSLGLFVLAGAALGCSLDGFAGGAAKPGAGGADAGGGGAGTAGAGAAGGGGADCGCACATWTAIQVSDSGPAVAPVIAWTGNGWAVAWQDARDGNNEIYFARLDASGARLGAEIRVTSDGADSLAPSLVWTGTSHAIAWEDWRSGNAAVYIAFVDAGGVETLDDTLVWSGSGAPKAPALGWSAGAGYTLTWEDFRDNGFKIHTGNVDGAGVVVHADERITDPATGDCHASTLAWGDNEYGVAWQDTRDGDEEVYFRRIDPAGYSIGVETRVTDVPGGAADVALAWTGAAYALVWSDARDGDPEIYFASLSAGGVPSGSEQRVTDAPGTSSWPAVAWGGGAHGVVWQDDRDGTAAIWFRALDAAGQPLTSEARVAGESAAAQRPALAWSGTTYGMVWQDQRGGSDAIYFAACTP